MRAPDSLFFLLRQTARLGLLTPLIALAQSPAFLQDAANPAITDEASAIELLGHAPDRKSVV